MDPIHLRALAGLPEQGSFPRPSAEVRPAVSSDMFRSALSARLSPTAVAGTKPPTRLVTPEKTPLSGQQAADALSRGYRDLYGQPPSKRTLAVLVGQWAMETGSGKSMYNHNFGGIKGTGPTGLSVAMRTREGHGESEVTIRDKFRAYESPAEGAKDYLSLLERRFPQAMSQARNGNAAGFVHALKQGGYFTGSEDAYRNAVTQVSQRVLEEGFDSVGKGWSAKAGATEDNKPPAPPPAISSLELVSLMQKLDAVALRILRDNPDDTDRGAPPWPRQR